MESERRGAPYTIGPAAVSRPIERHWVDGATKATFALLSAARCGYSRRLKHATGVSDEIAAGSGRAAFLPCLRRCARGAATYSTILAGIPCLLLGTAVHFWAKGCLRQNQVVTRSGPYRFVRHPFYLANGLIDAAIAIMSGWWLLGAILPVWWLAVYLPVMRKEEAHLCALFGRVYEHYRRRVPLLIPYRRPLPANGEGFRWSNRNIAVEGEIPRVLRLLAYPLLFIVLTALRSDGLSFFSRGIGLTATAALLAAYGLAAGLDRYLRGRGELITGLVCHGTRT